MGRHRTKRDEENAGGCPECAKLKRALAKAKREIHRLQGLEEPPPEVGEAAADKPKPSKGPKCPKCGSGNLGSYETPGGKTAVGCKECKKYKKIT